mgnify:CR=1 FL=1
MGTVTYQTARSIQIKEDNGVVHKFTQSEIDKRGIQLYMGDTADPRFPAESGRQDHRDHRDRGQAGDPHGERGECTARSRALHAPALRRSGTGCEPKRRLQPRPLHPAAEPAAEEPQAMEQAAPARGA